MDQQPPNDNQLSSYYHPHHHHHQHHHSPVPASPTNGLIPQSSAGAGDMVYPHSAPSAAPLESPKRKRGRPRKYGTPEQALAAKKATASSHKEKKEQQQQGFGGGSSSPPSSSYSGHSSRKSQLSGPGNSGQGFTPHVIGVAAGEDVAQKIMFFMQQNKREICILSASGSISSVSLRQPATSGGNISYEGRYEIVTLSGSYVRSEQGGRAGGLSICLSDANGQIIGGGVGGPLMAAGPVQVIIGSFSVDAKKDPSTVIKGDPSGKFSSPVGGHAASGGGYRPSGIDSSNPSQYMVPTGGRI